MKKMMMVTLMVLTSQMVMAQIPGAPVQHKLYCDTAENGEHILGVGYILKCATQPYAPQYSLKSCELLTTVVVPNAQPKMTSLSLKKQTAGFAYLENISQQVKVKVNKKMMTARIQFSNGLKLDCGQGQGPIGGGMSAGNGKKSEIN